jgi:hypothetical protein
MLFIHLFINLNCGLVCYDTVYYLVVIDISVYYIHVCLFSLRYNPLWLYFHSPVATLASSSSRFLDHTQLRATVGRTPLDE